MPTCPLKMALLDGLDEYPLAGAAADYVDRILKGAKPGELPVEDPPKFELGLGGPQFRTEGSPPWESESSFSRQSPPGLWQSLASSKGS